MPNWFTTRNRNVFFPRRMGDCQADDLSHLVESLGNKLSSHEILSRIRIPPERENKRASRGRLIRSISLQIPRQAENS